MKKREDIEEKYKWDLTPIYKSDDEALVDMETLKDRLELVSKYKGSLGNIDKCLEFLDEEQATSKIFNKVGVYLLLKRSEDLEKTKYIEMEDMLSTLGQKYSVATAFSDSEILSYGEEYVMSLINDVRFNDYKLGFIELLRGRKHVLNEAEETIVSLTSKAMGQYNEVFENTNVVDMKFDPAIDSKGKKRELNHDTFSLYMEDHDRILRKSAFEKLYKSYMDRANIFASNYLGSLYADCFYSKVYKYDSVLGESLFSDNIPESLYLKLVEQVEKHTPLLHKYFKLKKKIMGVKSLEYYDLYVSICDYNKKFKYEEGVEVVKQAVAPLGQDYVALIDRAVRERWLDVYPNKNKDSRCYSCGLYGVHPYVLLHDTGDMESVFTLAHELGHAMHSYFSDNTQVYTLADYSIFNAEIASTTNEVLLLKYFYNQAKTKKEKIYYLDRYLKMFKSTIYRQTMFSQFEHFAHTKVENDEPLSKQTMVDYYAELNKKYQGPAVKPCKEISYEWTRIPHFYRPYYVYKYSTGLISAICIASNILNDTPNAKENYREFLKAGGSDYPTNILKIAGVDLTEDAPYEIAFKEMKWALDELENLIK